MKEKFTSEFAFCDLQFIILSDRAIGKLPNLYRSQDDFGESNINNLRNLISLIILSLNNGTFKILILAEMEISDSEAPRRTPRIRLDIKENYRFIKSCVSDFFGELSYEYL